MKYNAVLSLLFAVRTLASPLVFTAQDAFLAPDHVVDPAILRAVAAHADPVEALLSLQPDLAEELHEPRLLSVGGVETWMTEGDKLRLRRDGLRFIDLTESAQHPLRSDLVSNKPHLPPLSHDKLVKPLFDCVSTSRMHDAVRQMTGFYTRYYKSAYGEQSARWLHDQIAGIVAESPSKSYISLSWFRHPWAQSSIIARFEAPITNASAPTTIIGAHQDSVNALFPFLPAPGADDDCSGSITILEAFRILANYGFVPENGPVEFHWAAAEEAGLLGSQQIAAHARDINMNVTAMIQFDLTAYVPHEVPEYMGIMTSGGDPELVQWTYELAKRYSSIPVEYIELPENIGGSDHESWTRQGYPAVAASESNPMAGGKFPGHMNWNVHTIKDRMDVDDEKGFYSIDHMARFTELAIAFAVEQAGWQDSQMAQSLQPAWF